MLYFTLTITALCGIVLFIQAIFLSHKYKTKDTNKSLSGRLDDNIRAVDIEQIMKKIFLFRIS